MDDVLLKALCNQADIPCQVIFRVPHLLGEYIELVPSDDKYSRVYIIAARSAAPVVYWQTGDTSSQYQGYLHKHEITFMRPWIEWADSFSSTTLEAFFMLTSSPSVLASLGLTRHMVEEVRNERSGHCTLYQTTNYNVACHLDAINVSNGHDKTSIKMDRALFGQFGCGDFYAKRIEPFVRQLQEWDEIASMARKGTLARRRLLLAVLDE